jgi:hypothetical protein
VIFCGIRQRLYYPAFKSVDYCNNFIIMQLKAFVLQYLQERIYRHQSLQDGPNSCADGQDKAENSLRKKA